MTRLQSYRAFLAAMNPSSNPGDALTRGFYVEPPGGGVWSSLTKKLELEPASTHLVLGGIGSGKTSELLRTVLKLRKSLRKTGDFVRYCDVSKWHDLSAQPEVGVLVAVTGLLLAKAIEKSEEDVDDDVEEAIASVREFARGAIDLDIDDDVDDDIDHEDGPFMPTSRRGVLVKPPDKRVHPRLADVRHDLETLLEHHPGSDRTAIMLFDSLDRLHQPAAFRQMVEDDIRVLKSRGVGLVIVGPVRFIVGSDRGLTDLFDHIHFQLATDPETPDGEAFLCEVLRRRTAESALLPEECLPQLARASGGVLRDLIALAKRSAEEAYATGHPKVTAEDVARASEAFGRSLAIGLDDDQLKILKAVAETGSFVVRGERELSLLETRRVLLHPENRWAVHPTLRGLIEEIPETHG